MTRSIWKFQLMAEEIQMPERAEVCTFQFQSGIPCVWAIVDPYAPTTVRRFKIFGTGHSLPDPEDCSYVETAQDGAFVWHLFELL